MASDPGTLNCGRPARVPGTATVISFIEQGVVSAGRAGGGSRLLLEAHDDQRPRPSVPILHYRTTVILVDPSKSLPTWTRLQRSQLSSMTLVAYLPLSPVVFDNLRQ